MFNGIALIFVGIGATINGILVYGKEPSVVEKTGWAYQNLGKNGISICLILLGVISFLIGVFVVKHRWKKIKK